LSFWFPIPVGLFLYRRWLHQRTKNWFLNGWSSVPGSGVYWIWPERLCGCKYHKAALVLFHYNIKRKLHGFILEVIRSRRSNNDRSTTE
jgi:hypothetical protein